MPDAIPDSTRTRALLELIQAGDGAALDQLLRRSRPKLQAFIDCRFDPCLQARLDASDLVRTANAWSALPEIKR